MKYFKRSSTCCSFPHNFIKQQRIADKEKTIARGFKNIQKSLTQAIFSAIVIFFSHSVYQVITLLSKITDITCPAWGLYAFIKIITKLFEKNSIHKISTFTFNSLTHNRFLSNEFLTSYKRYRKETKYMEVTDVNWPVFEVESESTYHINAWRHSWCVWSNAAMIDELRL